jgi:hypothetical protein
MWGRDSAVGIATRYGIKDPGFVPPWGQEIFSLPFQIGPPPSTPILGRWDLFRGYGDRWVALTQSSAVVKNGHNHISTPSVRHRTRYGVSFIFTFVTKFNLRRYRIKWLKLRHLWFVFKMHSILKTAGTTTTLRLFVVFLSLSKRKKATTA